METDTPRAIYFAPVGTFFPFSEVPAPKASDFHVMLFTPPTDWDKDSPTHSVFGSVRVRLELQEFSIQGEIQKFWKKTAHRLRAQLKP